MSTYSFIRSMYLCLASAKRALDNLMILGWVAVPIFTSSTWSQFRTSLGYFATSLWSKIFSNGTRPLGIALPFSCRISFPHRLFRYSCCSSDCYDSSDRPASTSSGAASVRKMGRPCDSSSNRAYGLSSTSADWETASGDESFSSMMSPLNFSSRWRKLWICSSSSNTYQFLTFSRT